MNERFHKALVVDDDAQIAALVKLHLEENGFSVVTVGNGLKAIELAKTGAYELIVLDVMLPGCNGTDVCRELRALKITARILMLTERGSETDKVVGLELGADDYVTKPFSVRELVARAKALLRRDAHGSASSTAPAPIILGDLVIDPAGREVRLEKEKLDLTSTEFDLLYYMAQHSGRAFSRETLLQAVWGYTSSAYEHTVNTHINRLRGKIERDPASPKFIKTVWGVGYKCVAAHELSQ